MGNGSTLFLSGISRHDSRPRWVEYYDNPEETAEGGAKRIENLVDREARWFPPSAHTGYWEHLAFTGELYAAVVR